MTFVYFISAGIAPVKIGISDTPEERLAALQTAHYKRLHLLFSIACNSRDEAMMLERAFHNWYKDKRLLNEWFDIKATDVHADVNLLNSLSKSAMSFHQHIQPNDMRRLEIRTDNIKASRDATGKFVICPGCNKKFAPGSIWRHKQTCVDYQNLQVVEESNNGS